MAEKVVNFSDFDGEMITNPGEEMVTIAVYGHPELEDEAVELQVKKSEVEQLGKLSIAKHVDIDVTMPGDRHPQQYVLTTANFAKLSPTRPMAEVLEEAKRIDSRREVVAPTIGQSLMSEYQPAKPKMDYQRDHAGFPHKGKTTIEEQSFVRRHLNQQNEKLLADGKRLIDPRVPDIAKRYVLTDEHIKIYDEWVEQKQAEREAEQEAARAEREKEAAQRAEAPSEEAPAEQQAE